jgi:UDP-N-acetylmuramoyl-tripeptide--D-alanyl-D-alanine ligase
MKSVIKNIGFKLLLSRARKVLAQKPEIIGITGSVGKTSTRAAITAVLSKKYIVSSHPANFNTPVGLLLSILEIDDYATSITGWIKLVWHAYRKPLPKPEILVLEFGIDAPQDMERLLSVAQPDIAVIAPIAGVHLGEKQFSTVAQIREEKLKLAHAARQFVIGNGFDHETTHKLNDELPDQCRFFGATATSHYRLDDISIGNLGTTFRIDEEYYFVPVYGKFQPQIFAPAIILGQLKSVNAADIKSALSHFQPPAGRGRIIPAKQNSVVWDFSYNSSPIAAQAALFALPEIPGYSRKIALLGQMNELGNRAIKEHLLLAKIATEQADVIIFVGGYDQEFEAGVDSKKPLYCFSNAHEAGTFLQTFLEEYDFVLVKGSQTNVYLEGAIEQILANPADKKLLCRRSDHWESVRQKHFSAQNSVHE